MPTEEAAHSGRWMIVLEVAVPPSGFRLVCEVMLRGEYVSTPIGLAFWVLIDDGMNLSARILKFYEPIGSQNRQPPLNGQLTITHILKVSLASSGLLLPIQRATTTLIRS